MNVYDFDGTIYDGDSTADFYKYCLKRHPKILKTVPMTLWSFLLYVTGFYEKTRFKEIMYRFLTCVDDIDSELNAFWNLNISKIKPYYKDTHKDDDIVISASPEFLLYPICEKLKIHTLIASKVDKHTGKYTGINCRDTEKVRRLYEKMGEVKINDFYSDSYADTPLAKLSERAYMVKGNKITPWDFKKD